MSLNKRHLIGRAGRWIRLHLLRAVRENSTPARTALGLGVGVFIGIFPSFLIGTPLAYLCAGRLGLNRAAAVAGTIIMNPVTAPFLYWWSAELGQELLQSELRQVEIQGFWGYLQHNAAAFFLGSALVALLFAGLLGLAGFLIVRRWGPHGLRAMLVKRRIYRSASSARIS